MHHPNFNFNIFSFSILVSVLEGSFVSVCRTSVCFWMLTVMKVLFWSNLNYKFITNGLQMHSVWVSCQNALRAVFSRQHSLDEMCRSFSFSWKIRWNSLSFIYSIVSWFTQLMNWFSDFFFCRRRIAGLWQTIILNVKSWCLVLPYAPDLWVKTS